MPTAIGMVLASARGAEWVMPRLHHSVRAIAAVGAILDVLYAETDKTLAGVAAFLSDLRANERASRECFARWSAAGREVAELRTFRAKAIKMAFPSLATAQSLGLFWQSIRPLGSGIKIRHLSLESLSVFVKRWL
jgi:hypothetical protein